MADFATLKTVVSESKTTLASAARTIRSLIQQRNYALAAAKPADVVAATKNSKEVAEAEELQLGLESVRQDTERAISEAGAPPVIPVKPPAPTPVVAPAAPVTDAPAVHPAP